MDRLSIEGPDVTEEELNSRLPIIPHAAIADTDCPGCLVVGLKGSTCEVLCNECGSLVATSLPVTNVEEFLRNLYRPGKTTGQ